MQEFFNSLYEIENFTTYLSIAIAVLVVLFFLVLFLGKKDQKLEETKRLEKLELDGFKETSKPVKVEMVSEKRSVPSEETISLPVLETSDINQSVEATSVLPVINEVPEESTLSALQDLTDGNIELPRMKESVLEVSGQDEREEPISVSEIKSIEEPSIIPDTFKMPELKEEIKFPEVVVDEKIELPEFNFDDVISSLNEETVIKSETPKINVVEEIVLPVLEEKNEDLVVKEETKKYVGQPIFSSVYVPKKEEKIVDDVIDLTEVSESKEVKSDVAFNTSFDSILGESYDIK